MADNRYGDYGRREGWRGRDSSIFSDDDDDRSRRGSGRWSSDYGRERGGWSGRGDEQRDWDDGRREELGWGRGRHDQRGGGGDDDRGFFERAGDEVRSWFGDEEAERRRERDMGRDPSGRAFTSRDNGGRADLGGYEGRSRSGAGGFGGASFGQERGGFGGGQRAFGGGRSQWDDNYRRWRDQQIAQLDREYEEYCLQCQDQFEQDFSSWRTSRLTQGGTGSASDATGGSSSGAILQGGQSAGSGGTGGAETAGATSSAGGTASATESSTGSSGGGAGRRSPS